MVATVAEVAGKTINRKHIEGPVGVQARKEAIKLALVIRELRGLDS